MKDHNINENHLQREGFLAKRVSVSEFHKFLGNLISPKEPRRIQMMQLKKYVIDLMAYFSKITSPSKSTKSYTEVSMFPRFNIYYKGQTLNEKDLYDVAK